MNLFPKLRNQRYRATQCFSETICYFTIDLLFLVKFFNLAWLLSKKMSFNTDFWQKNSVTQQLHRI